MDARTRVLFVDFGVAAVAVTVGLVVTPWRSVGVAVLVALGAVVSVGALALAELTDALALIDARRPGSLLLVAAATFAVAIALVLGRLAVPLPSAPIIVGAGVGLAAHRTVFGLLRPIPPAREAQADLDWP